MTQNTIFRDVKYEFSEAELMEIGFKLARATKAVYDLEADKKDETARVAAALKEANSRVAQLAWKLNCRYEVRSVECVRILDEPRVGMKRLLRADNGELVAEEPMSDDEKQGRLLFDDRPEEGGKE